MAQGQAKTVGIVGGSLSGNKGAEAMVRAVMGSLRARRGDVRFLLFSPYPKADKPLEGRYPDTTLVGAAPACLALKMFPWAVLSGLLRRLGLKRAVGCRALRSLDRCDLVVDVAGISFSDGREMLLPYNVLTVLPAMLLGKPVAKLSQAMGPFHGRLNRVLAGATLRRCRLLVARGWHTAENLRSIGLRDFLECPDVAFCLNELEDMRSLDGALARHTAFGSAGRRLVGISPSSVVHESCRRNGVDYIDLHAGFIRHLTEAGYRVLLLPHSLRAGTARLKNNDLPVIDRLLSRLGPAGEVAAVREDLDSTALRKLIGRCDFFLASRFHSMIAALAMNVPVMVCGWGHKYFEILDLFGQRDCALDYRELSLERMKETFARLVRNEGAIRSAIGAALPGVQQAARKQMDAAAALLEDRPMDGRR